MSLFDLAGKVALVTGGSRGIGRATVEELARAGARVAFCSESEADVLQAKRQLGADFLGVVCDVRDGAAQKALVELTLDRFGGLDTLVCNAGITGQPGGFATLDMTDYDRVMDINLRSAVVLSQLALPRIAERGGGAVIFTGSISGVRGNRGISSYALAKAGLAQLARNLAVEWGPKNIRANTVSPGLISTELSAPLRADENFMARRMQMTPLRRSGEPQEVAGTIVWLASAAGAFVTGQNIVVDGGTVITDGS